MSRVLVVTNDFPTRRGGIESFVLALCQQMPADDVVVYTASMPGDREHDAGLPYPVYRDPSSMLLPTPAVARRVSEVLRRHECDRVLFGASAPLGLLAPALRRAGARRQVALTHGHEVWWARVPVTRQLLRRIADHVDVMTYVSEWCHERIAPALSPAGRGRMRRLSPGVDPQRFYPGCGGADVRRRLGLAADTPVVVCLGRLVPRKGQDTLVRAWPEVLRTPSGCPAAPRRGRSRPRPPRTAGGPGRGAGGRDVHRRCRVGGRAGVHRRGRRVRDALPDPATGPGGRGVGDRVPRGPGVRSAGGDRRVGRGPGDARRPRARWSTGGRGRRRRL